MPSRTNRQILEDLEQLAKDMQATLLRIKAELDAVYEDKFLLDTTPEVVITPELPRGSEYQTKPESWLGRNVAITAGRMKGYYGRVIDERPHITGGMERYVDFGDGLIPEWNKDEFLANWIDGPDRSVAGTGG